MKKNNSHQRIPKRNINKISLTGFVLLVNFLGLLNWIMLSFKLFNGPIETKRIQSTLYYLILYHIILYYIILYYIILYYIISYYIILYYIILYHITLNIITIDLVTSYNIKSHHITIIYILFKKKKSNGPSTKHLFSL